MLAPGDHGLGTFDHLDGELVVVDGTAWRVYDHEAMEPVDKTENLTPCAAVTRFAPRGEPQPISCADIAGLHPQPDACRPSDEHLIGARIEGRFTRLVIPVACGANEGERPGEA